MQSKSMLLGYFFAFAAILQPAGAVHADPRRAVLASLAMDETRVADIAYRLARHAGDLCPVRVPGIAILVHDAAQYRSAYRPAAIALFDLGERPAVLAVAQDGPASRAGVFAGDAIRAIDGVAVPPPAEANGYARVAAVLAQIDAAAAKGVVTLSLERGGAPFVAHVAPESLCPARYQVAVDREPDAEANGAYVEVTTGLIAFTRSDDELAGVLAHELAHNILQHRKRLAAAGVPESGARSRADERLVRATEIEADRLSVYLADRAGYSTAAIVSFWRRMAARDGFEHASSHPSDAKRIAIISAEIDRIARLKALGQEPKPDFAEAPVPPG